MKHIHVRVCVEIITYGLETDSRRDGVNNCVRMRKVREVASLNPFEVHGLKIEISCVVNDERFCKIQQQTQQYNSTLSTRCCRAAAAKVTARISSYLHLSIKISVLSIKKLTRGELRGGPLRNEKSVVTLLV